MLEQEIRNLSNIRNLPYLGIRLFMRFLLGKGYRDYLIGKGVLDPRGFSRRIARFMPPSIISLDWCGLKAYVRDFEDVCMLSKSFESELFPFFTPKHGDVVIDVGAHIGRYTLLVSNLVGDRGKVVSFEPDRSNFRILSMNVGLNKLRNVTLLPFVAGEFDGETIFYLSSWTALGSIIPSSKRRYSRLRSK